MQYGPGYALWFISMTVNDVIIKSDVRKNHCDTFLIEFHASMFSRGAAIMILCIKLRNFMQYGPGYALWFISMTVNDVIIKSDVRVVSGI